ncbi:MAG: MFS transporter [Methanomassiliicoccales archaeon]
MASGQRPRSYRIAWMWLFTAWMFCYIDRTIMGPVVSWMIDHQVSFISGAPMPHALGGIIGGMFFAGYVLTQFPAGYLGDRYGSKAMVVISTVWAGIATLITGLTRSLNAFVMARVITGLGQGAYYSNDRALVAAVSPKEKKGLGMGVVFVGLSAGLTVGTIATPYIIDWGADIWGPEQAWSLPFLIFSLPTVLVGLSLYRFIRTGKAQEYRQALWRLLAYAAVFLVVIMTTYLLAVEWGWTNLAQAGMVILVTLALVAVIYWVLGVRSAPVLKNRNLLLMYLSAVPIPYTLWFFGYWALLVVSEVSEMGLSGVAVYAGLFGVANGIGYPLGGRLCDRSAVAGKGRRRTYLFLSLAVAVLILLLGVQVSSGGRDVMILGALMFAIGVPFAAMQTVHMTLTSDLAPPEMTGQAFGMWNLTAQIGAVLSPVVSGTLRDLTGDWVLAIVLTGGMVLASCLLVLLVREPKIHTA